MLGLKSSYLLLRNTRLHTVDTWIKFIKKKLLGQACLLKTHGVGLKDPVVRTFLKKRDLCSEPFSDQKAH